MGEVLRGQCRGHQNPTTSFAWTRVRREAPTPEWRTLAHAETPRQAGRLRGVVNARRARGPSSSCARREPRTLGGLGVNHACLPTHRFFRPRNCLTCRAAPPTLCLPTTRQETRPHETHVSAQSPPPEE